MVSITRSFMCRVIQPHETELRGHFPTLEG
jgi:hypothetical protein